MDKITVVDAVMGSGKSSWAIQHINEANPLQRFIYITPFLDEIDRVIKGVTSRVMVEPRRETGSGRKMTSLKRLIERGANIAATHALFEAVDDELIELLKAANYILILDEVMQVVSKANMTPDDIRALRKLEWIEVVDNQVEWVADEDEYVSGVFEDIKLQAEAGNLFYHRGRYLIWSFPPVVFSTFLDVYVLTYLFHGQFQRYYFDLHGIEYEIKSVIGDRETGYRLVEYDKKIERRRELYELIDIYDGDMNVVGDFPTAFSTGWLKRRTKSDKDQIKRNLSNYFRNILKTASKDTQWTTVLSHKSAFSGAGYARGFVVVNQRATNDYQDRKALAYCYNVFMNPTFEKAFFQDNGITVDEDLYGVSEALQWIWRSQIRNGKMINLYMPSSRMRGLLKAWANYEI